MQLMQGGGGPPWSLARVRGLLARSRRALALCQAWLPKAAWQMAKQPVGEMQAQADAIAAAQPRAGDSLPSTATVHTAQSSQPTLSHPVPTCDACGRQSLSVKKCAACGTVVYW